MADQLYQMLQAPGNTGDVPDFMPKIRRMTYNSPMWVLLVNCLLWQDVVLSKCVAMDCNKTSRIPDRVPMSWTILCKTAFVLNVSMSGCLRWLVVSWSLFAWTFSVSLGHGCFILNWQQIANFIENLKRVWKLTDLCWIVDVLVGFG
jgi:hypothetical protein